MHKRYHPLLLLSVVGLAGLLSSCTWFGAGNAPPPPNVPAPVQSVQFLDALRLAASNPPVLVRGARNETVHIALRINQLPQIGVKRKTALRLSPFQLADNPQAAIPSAACSAFQVLSMPVDANRAGFVRHTGLAIAEQRFPRALLPLPATEGLVNLWTLRDPANPTDPQSHPDPDASAPPIVWIDIDIPPTAAPGQYTANFDLLDDGDAVFSTPIQLAVDEFVLPDERHLLMVGTLDFDRLLKLYPSQFQGIEPGMLSRKEERYAPAINVLDDIVRLGHAHRTEIDVPMLQPVVKWPSAKPPQIDWTDFDSVVGPWLRGDAFPDNVPLGYWPLPAIEHLDLHATTSRLEYWLAAATHFDQLDWLGRSAVAIAPPRGGRSSIAESVAASAWAARLLAIHPRLRVTVPLEEEQVQLATAANAQWIPADQVDRLLYSAAGLVSMPPLQRLPDSATGRWLRTDLGGLVPYIGAGADEREVRLWAFLAYMRGAQSIQWKSVLPAQDDGATPADPDELVWFYPGSWFGVDHPVPTLQLKWLRRAQQDYEYLYLAQQRGQRQRAQLLARLLAKPVQLLAAQVPDPVYGLLSGSSEPASWEQAHELLARTIRLSQPGQSIDPEAERQLSYDITAWTDSQARPLMLARSADWTFGIRDADGTDWLNLRLGLSLYSPAEPQPQAGKLQWAAVPEAWNVRAAAIDVPPMGLFSVNNLSLEARIDLDRISPATRHPVKVLFTDGYTGRSFALEIMAPIAVSAQREGAPPKIDGSLGDWSQEDLFHEGRLVQLLSRPAVQHQEMTLAPADSSLYSTWTATSLYLGFKVDGADAPVSSAETSFVDYQFRRAWGEDICEVLLQPIYANGSVGPLLHIAMKPRGQLEVSRRLDRKLNATPWQAFASSDIRYAANVLPDSTVWRGELVIPWDALVPPNQTAKVPTLLRLNFIQHRGSTGQSASWAGPIDFGRDDAFTGLLQIRPPEPTGIVPRAQR